MTAQFSVVNSSAHSGRINPSRQRQLRLPPDAVHALRRRLADHGIPIVEEWDEPDYVSVKCSDPEGYVVEAAWEPERRVPVKDT